MRDPNLPLTRPFLPPLDDFVSSLQEIWTSGQLSNGGVQHQRLEAALADMLDIEHLSLVANGTLALIAALRALDVGGEVVTTPFSFVATANAIVLAGAQPVFADIEPESLNLDPAAVEAAITPRTTALLPVHVFGRPCDHAALQAIADRRGLKLVYDGAHAFGVRNASGSLWRQGNASTMSFHATKVFHTFEGGAIACRDARTKQWIDRFANHGLQDESTLVAIGINAKLNEVQAAFGRLHLEHLPVVIAARASVDARYRRGLASVPGMQPLPLPPGIQSNFGYFPILVDESWGLNRDALHDRLRASGINVRRYFHPLIPEFAPYRALRRDSAPLTTILPVASDAARRVLCLPIHAAMTAAEVDRVVGELSAAAARG